MCAILGIISKQDNQYFSVSELWDMCEAQAHRGPDDRGGISFSIEENTCKDISHEQYIQGKGLLGFQRLSIQDLSVNGHQPMLDESKKVAIIFNGEIYNFKSLRKQLQQKGYEFKSGTDTEVLLSMYLSNGLEKTLALINGMYSFAILDMRINKLFIVRDCFGIKPLYIANTDEAILFSSEIKPFLKYHGFEVKFDIEAFEELLLFKENIKNTMFHGVEEVEPGTITIYDLETNLCRVEKYFDIENYNRQDNNTPIKDLIDEAECLLKKVVDRQLISDTRVGCQLSGGIDSSIISRICANEFGKKDAISCITDTQYQSDAPYIKQVVEELELNSYTIEFDSRRFVDNLVDVVWYFERPLSHTPAAGMFQISKCSKNNGITVLLSGEGADECFGGYKGFLQTAFAQHDMTEDELIEAIVFRDGKDVFGDLEKVLPGIQSEKYYEERIKILRHFTGTPFDKQLKYETSVQLLELLNRQDRMSMANSIENRVPFLDKEVVDFAWRIPQKALMDEKRKTGKFILKELAKKYFNENFAYRTKVGFFIPGNRYLSENKKFMEGIIEKARRRGILQTEIIEKWGKEEALITGGLNYFQSAIFFKAITFEIWCELFLDGKTVEECKGSF